MIFPSPGLSLESRYPDAPAKLEHTLADEPLLKADSILALATTLPPVSIEYNAGDLPIDQDPLQTPMTGLGVEETIIRIRDCKSWMVLKNIEQNPAYAALLDRCLEEIAPLTRARTGPMQKQEGFIFLSSPGAVTPFHMDPEHNILMQISGAKTVTVYPTAISRALPAALHEAYHAGEGHRNLRYDPAMEAVAESFQCRPGDAVYIPVKAPHRVTVGDAVSVSLSVTWRSRASDCEARRHLANRWFRRFGLRPTPPGAPLENGVKSVVYRAARRFSRTW